MNELNSYTMLQTLLSYLMIVSFMFVIIKRKLSPFISLVLIPLLFTVIFILLGMPQNMPVGIFVIFVLVICLTGQLPVYIPQTN